MSVGKECNFADLVAELGQGAFNDEATKLLGEVAERIRKFGGAGRLVITLALEDSGGGSIEIESSFRTKKPHAPIPKTRVWADEDGAILTADPNQEVLPFRRPKGPRETT